MSSPVSLLRADEVADILRTNPWFVTAECRAGRLRAYRPGRAWLIPADAIPEYLEAHCRPQDPKLPSPQTRSRRRKRERIA